MIKKKGKPTDDHEKECMRIRGKCILLPDCYLDDGTIQVTCTECPICRMENIP